MSSTTASAPDLDTVVFAFGPGERYLCNSEQHCTRNNLPKPLTDLFNRTADITVYRAAFGTHPSSYFVNYSAGGKTRIAWQRLPVELGTWLKAKPRQKPHVALGPGESFFAWDKYGFRWHGLPAPLEATLQGWCRPEGWLHGPPRWVTLGVDGSYMVFSTRDRCDWDVEENYPTLHKLLETWSSKAKLCEEVKRIWLHPFKKDNYVLVSTTGHVWFRSEAPTSPYIKVVATAISDPDAAVRNHLALMEAERAESRDALRKQRQQAEKESRDALRRAELEEKRRAKEAAQREKEKAQEEARARAKAVKEEAARKERWRKTQEELAAKARAREKEKEDLKRLAAAWVTRRKIAFKNIASLTKFPDPPASQCKCAEESCKMRKAEPGALKACLHDVERLVRQDPNFSHKWLRKERLVWHPDRWARAPAAKRDEFTKKAGQLFIMYGEMSSI